LVCYSFCLGVISFDLTVNPNVLINLKNTRKVAQAAPDPLAKVFWPKNSITNAYKNLWPILPQGNTPLPHGKGVWNCLTHDGIETAAHTFGFAGGLGNRAVFEKSSTHNAGELTSQ
jgi:hypothetical protein